jgi:hypothetical protein
VTDWQAVAASPYPVEDARTYTQRNHDDFALHSAGEEGERNCIHWKEYRRGGIGKETEPL